MSSPLLFLEGIGTSEMVFILVVILIFFGPKKIPELARGLGKGIRDFKDASNEIRNEFERAGDPYNGQSNPNFRPGGQPQQPAYQPPYAPPAAPYVPHPEVYPPQPAGDAGGYSAAGSVISPPAAAPEVHSSHVFDTPLPAATPGTGNFGNGRPPLDQPSSDA